MLAKQNSYSGYYIAWHAKPKARDSVVSGSKTSLISALSYVSSTSDTIGLPSFANEAKWRLEAEPMFLELDRKLFLNSRIGEFLEDHRMWEISTIVVAVLLILCGLASPGSQSIEATDGTSTIKTRISSTPTLAMLCALAPTMWFLLAHRCNRLLFFKALRYFECLVLVGSVIFGEIIYIWVHLTNYSDAAYGNNQALMVVHMLGQAIVVVPPIVYIGALDCLRVAKPAKLLIISLGFAFRLFNWIQHRFFSDLWPEKTCIGDFCQSPRELYCLVQAQAAVFLAKAIATYWSHPLAFVHPHYTIKEQVWSEEERYDHSTENHSSGEASCSNLLQHFGNRSETCTNDRDEAACSAPRSSEQLEMLPICLSRASIGSRLSL